MNFKDGGDCTSFPEYWYQWYLYKGFIPAWRKVYIGWMCKKHDERCGSHSFYKDTWQARLIGAVAIASIASLACWVKYRKLMLGKL